METTIELADLDALVADLDTRISETVTVDDAQGISLLLCSYACGGGGGGGSWYNCW